MKARTMKLSMISAAALIAIAATNAAAQAPLTLQVSTGDKTLTYSTMFDQIRERCSGEVPMVNVNSSGTVENIDRLVGNKVNAAFVQSDVLWFRDKTESLGHIKTLLAMHPEQVHLLALTNSGLKAGNIINRREVVFTDVSSLAGYAVGASGGAAITANVIRLQTEVPFNVVEFGSSKDLVAALQGGQIQAAVFVGGAPLPLFESLNKAYKLIPINGPAAEKLKSAYRTTTISYSNLNQSTGVQTVTTDALFVTRDYSTPRMVDALSRLRSCVLSNLRDIKETTNTHPAWQKVQADNMGKWPHIWEFPAQGKK